MQTGIQSLQSSSLVGRIGDGWGGNITTNHSRIGNLTWVDAEEVRSVPSCDSCTSDVSAMRLCLSVSAMRLSTLSRKQTQKRRFDR